MRILLTGVHWDYTGMIGSRLNVMLQEAGHEVIPFEGDIRDVSNWMYYLNDSFDIIIHLAAKAGVRESMENPDYYEDVNVNGTMNAFKFAKFNGTKILYASSSNAYEWWLNPYAMTKKANEHMAKAMDINAIGMRFHTVWPGRQDMLFRKIENGNVNYINVNHTRDFIHVDDLCNGIITIMNNFDKVRAKKDVVDIGTGEAVSVFDVFMRYWDTKKYQHAVEIHRGETKGERAHTCADVEYLKELGWSPKHNILAKEMTINFIVE